MNFSCLQFAAASAMAFPGDCGAGTATSLRQDAAEQSHFDIIRDYSSGPDLRAKPIANKREQPRTMADNQRASQNGLPGFGSFLSCFSPDYKITLTALGHNISSNDLETGSPTPSSSVSYNRMYKTKGIVGPSLKHIQPSCTKLFAHYNYRMMRYRHDSKESAAATVKAKQCPRPPSITPASVAFFMLQHGCSLPQAFGTFAISANFSVRGYASHCVRPTFSRRDLTLFTSESRSKPRVVIQTPLPVPENPGCMNYMGIDKLLTIIATAVATAKLPRLMYSELCRQRSWVKHKSRKQ
jgi:hypothetical protein